MSTESIPAVVLASIAFYVGAYHLLVYLRQPHPRENLTFALCCFSIMLYDLFCAGLYNVSSPEQGVHWQTLQSLALNVGAIALVWFTVDYTRWKPVRLVWTLTLLWLPPIAITVFGPGTLLWLDQPHVREIALPFGGSVTYQEMAPGPLNAYTALLSAAVFGFALWAGIRLFRRGQRQRGTPLIVATSLFFAGVFNDSAVTTGVYQFVYLIEYTFLSLVVLMAYTLSNEVLKAAGVKEKLRQSEELLRDTLNSTGDGIAVVDREFHILTYNPRFAEMWRFPEELLRTSRHAGRLIDLASEQIEDLQTFQARMRLLWESNQESLDEIRFKDGRIFEQSSFPLMRDSKMAGRIWSFREVTEHRKAQAALGESETRYQALFETMAQGVVYQDAGGQITSINPAGERILGLSSEQIFGRTSTDPRWHAIHEDGSAFPGENHPSMVSLSTGQPVHNVVMGVFNPLEEQYRWILVSAIPQFRPGEETPYQVYTSFTDITDLRRAEEALRQSEANYRMLFSAETDAILSIDVETRGILDANPAAETMYGYTREELRGLSVLQLTAEPEKAEDYFARIMAGDREALSRPTVQRNHRRKDGSVFPVETSTGVYTLGDRKMVCAIVRDITRRHRAEADRDKLTEHLKETSTLLEAILDTIPDVIGVQDIHHRIIRYNQAGYRFVNLTPEQVLGKRCFELIGRTMPCPICATTRAVQEKKPSQVEKYVEEMGVWLDARAYPILDDAGRVTMVIEHLRDITHEKAVEAEKEKLEEQLQQAQKMEAIGRLAGGVAHDFNNILTGISGYTEMVLADLDPEDPRHKDLEEILKAANNAAQLTNQLLAFSRKQVITPQLIRLNDVITESQRMLQRMIGEDIDLAVFPGPDLWFIRSDPGQIEQVLVNLAANARDAMPLGGKLTIETSNVHIDANYSQTHTGVEAGDYVLLAVSDNGVGMEEETQKHIFEPFFSTKQKGRGTGLGLATVYGIVQQNGGFIQVYSELHYGTSFKIYLPRVVEQPREEREAISVADLLTGDETILLVEDEVIVRTLAERILQRLGYRVLATADSQDALAICQTHQEAIHLLLTDVVMPVMNGWELYQLLKSMRPDLKVLFMSGYPENVIAHHGVLRQGTHFVSKPFKVETLARKVREALDEPV